VMMDKNNPADAERLFREAMTAFQQALGPNHWMTATTHRAIGTALRDQRRFADAEIELLAAERVLASAEVSNDRYFRSVNALVSLYEQWNQSEPGKGYDQKARQWQSKIPSTRPATSQATRS